MPSHPRPAAPSSGSSTQRPRWHPKRLWRFLRRSVRGLRYLSRTNAPAAVVRAFVRDHWQAQELEAPYLPQLARFRERARHLDVSNDWFTRHIPAWAGAFDRYRLAQAAALRVLEIGSWQGLSSHYLLDALPQATLVCVDTWQGGDEHRSGDAASAEVLGRIEQSFDRNLAAFRGRYEKFKGTSFEYFAQAGDARFDLIYVDGSHYCDDVLLDATQGFEHLRVGGLMIFDDYLWQYYPHPMQNPAGAINYFLQSKAGCYRVVRCYYQVIIEKTAEPARA